MTKGDKIIVTIAGRRLEGIVHLISENGRSLAVSFDEGVPAPFFVDQSRSTQELLLFKASSGTWSELAGGRDVTVGEVES